MQVHRRKSASADRDQQRVVKCSRDASRRSDCLIIKETAVVNAQPRTSTESSQSARSEQMVISQDESCQWTLIPADAWKDQERILPSWQRCQ